MKVIDGHINGIEVARYSNKAGYKITCKVNGNFYCVTFHGGKSIKTFCSENKWEMNMYVKNAIKAGYKREI